MSDRDELTEIVERCGCGASIRVAQSSTGMASLHPVVKDWREKHVCPGRPVGSQSHEPVEQEERP